MARDYFLNPANGERYDWTVSHSDEDEAGKRRTINTVGTTGGGRVFHQGVEEPYTIRWSGKILHRAQFVQMWRWYAITRNQTIHLYDFDGQGYIVQITDFQPKRRRKLSFTGRDSSIPHHYWEYNIEFTVYGFLNGDMVAAGVVA